MLKINQLKIAYGDNLVLDHVDLEFKIGMTCLIGQSGCGKSSVLNALVHQIDFDADKYSYNQVNLLEKDADFFRNNISYLTQTNNFISDLSCFENIRLFASFGGIEMTDAEIQDCLNQVGLTIINKKSFPDELSGGEKQRLAIAQAIAKKTQIILCDEITASLDYDTKIEIFHLLQKLSKNNQSIIIMTSHDEDIYEQCDCVYRIENQSVYLEKSTFNNDENNQSIKEKTKSMLPKRMINQYVVSKLDRQKFYSILYSVITALVVALCAFLTFFTHSSLSEQQKILNRLSQNQIYVIHQTTPAMEGSSYSYYTNNQTFDSTIKDQLMKIDGVDTIYPYYWISLTEPQAIRDQSVEIKVCYEDKDEKIINIGANAFEFSLIPYNREQGFEDKMTIINPTNKDFGVYVNHIFLLMTGLTEEDLVGATIKTTVYPPVAYEIGNSQLFIHDTNERLDIIEHNPIGVPIEIEIPILGYVDFWYNEDWAQSFIYCPIDYMESLRNQVNQTYRLNENEKLWQPNAYIAFVENLEKMDEVNISIRNIDENIATGNKYMDNTTMYKQKRYIETTALIAIGVVLLAGIILSYTYGVYHYQKQQNDIAYFKRNWLLKKEFQQLLLFDCLYQIGMNLIFAIPFAILISYFGQIHFNMVPFGMMSSQAFMILILMVIFACLQTLISRVYYYRKVK